MGQNNGSNERSLEFRSISVRIGVESSVFVCECEENGVGGGIMVTFTKW